MNNNHLFCDKWEGIRLLFDYGLENNKGVRYVYNVIKKTWSRYFLGDSLLSGARYFRDLLEVTKFWRYFREFVTIRT